MSNFERTLPVLTALAISACDGSSEVDRDAWRAHERDMQALVMSHVDELEADCAASIGPARKNAFVGGEDGELTFLRMERDFRERLRSEMEIVDGLLEANDCWVDWNMVGCDLLNGNLNFTYIPDTWMQSTPQVTCSSIPFKA